ncbi:tail fiber protein [Bacillus phage Eldridge]|uniref:Pectate lyase superfamily protein domain-containing protein n=1 Tax=Bacillus phage Eldridge TaxID=1776293 RepID=A0A109QIW3_9CAUD|nr:tail fiber protein [Bacillus phage Eldridge]AMB18774.1 hypothetical protein Eldridge_0194 [Bacillus phage Eldridge]
MSNLFRDNLYESFPDPNKKIDDIGDQLTSTNKKLAGWVDVTQAPFKAKGDGSDDTVAIQNAVNFAVASGLALFFPNGTYSIADNDADAKIIKVLNANNLTIFGYGGAVIKCPSAFFGDAFSFENCNNVTVEGLVLNGGGDGKVNTAAGNVGLSFIKGTRDITVTKNKFIGWTDTALRCITQSPPNDSSGLSATDTTRSNLVVTANHFTQNEHCLITKYGGTRNVVIANNTVYQGAFGFKIDGESFSSYTPSWVWTDLPTFSGNAVISNNVFSELDPQDNTQVWTNGAVIIEEHAENVLIANNIMTDFNNVCGVSISGGQGDRPFRNISILNNKMINFNTGIGVRVDGGVGRNVEDVVIEGNMFKKFNASAIRIEAKKDLAGLIVSKNKFIDLCQNTSFLITNPIPTDIGVYIVNKTPNTYYVRHSSFSDNKFYFNDSSTFSESKYYLVVQGFKVPLLEDMIVENNHFSRPYTTTGSTGGFTVNNMEKLLFRNNYLESGRMYVQSSTVTYKNNKGYGFRMSVGSSGLTATVNLSNSEFIPDGSGLTEAIKAESSSTVTVDNVVMNTMTITTLTSSTLTDKSPTIVKTVAPTVNAQFIGQVYINTTSGSEAVYIAVKLGTGATDWKLVS